MKFLYSKWKEYIIMKCQSRIKTDVSRLQEGNGQFSDRSKHVQRQGYP